MPTQTFAFRELPTTDQSGVTLNFEQLTAGLNPVWIQPVFEHEWVNFEANKRKAEYVKDLLGWVHLRGVIKAGKSGESAFTLPAGFRPGQLEGPFMANAAANNTFGVVNIETSGAVSPANGTGEVKTFVTLDGITFRAEN